jgi:hypothetical protein
VACWSGERRITNQFNQQTFRYNLPTPTTSMHNPHSNCACLSNKSKFLQNLTKQKEAKSASLSAFANRITYNNIIVNE